MAQYRVDWPAWPDWFEAGGTPGRTQASGASGGGYLNSVDADGTYLGWKVCVAAGTYTLTLVYPKTTTRGKLQMSVDGVDVGTLLDAYNGSTTYNNVHTATGIALTEGPHTVRITVNGKNASSTGYRIGAQWLSLERTGD